MARFLTNESNVSAAIQDVYARTECGQEDTGPSEAEPHRALHARRSEAQPR
jgi:hypothetical protein